MRTTIVGAICALLLTLLSAPVSTALCTVDFHGSAASIMRLSIVDYGAAPNGVRSSQNLSQTSASVTFADRVGPRGSAASGHLGLQIKSNCPYALRMSRSSWFAQNLQYKGHNIGAEDGGSFIRVASRGVTGSYQSNPTGTIVEPSLSGSGTLLSQITSGPVTSHSTLLVHGAPACLAGGVDSPNNGLTVHLDLSCVDGNQLAAINRNSRAFFETTLQFQVFAHNFR